MDGDIFSFCLDEISEKKRGEENIHELHSRMFEVVEESTQLMSTDIILETFVKQYRYRR